ERQRKVACHSTAFLDSSGALLGAVCCGEVRLFRRTSGSASGRLRATRLHSSTHHVRSWAQSVAEKFGCSAELVGAPAGGCVPLDCIPRLFTRAPGRRLLRRSLHVPPTFEERQRKVACHSTAFLDSSSALLGAVCCGEVRLFRRTSGSASGRLR